MSDALREGVTPTMIGEANGNVSRLPEPMLAQWFVFENHLRDVLMPELGAVAERSIAAVRPVFLRAARPRLNDPTPTSETIDKDISRWVSRALQEIVFEIAARSVRLWAQIGPRAMVAFPLIAEAHGGPVIALDQARLDRANAQAADTLFDLFARQGVDREAAAFASDTADGLMRRYAGPITIMPVPGQELQAINAVVFAVIADALLELARREAKLIELGGRSC